MNGKLPDLESFQSDHGRHRAREKFAAFWGDAPKGEAFVPSLPSTESTHSVETTWTKFDDAQVVLHTLRLQREQRQKEQSNDDERSES